MLKLRRMLFGEKRSCNHVTKNCLIIHKYSSYFPERSLDWPKKSDLEHNHNNLSANCIMIIGQILELFSTANLDYRKTLA